MTETEISRAMVAVEQAFGRVFSLPPAMRRVRAVYVGLDNLCAFLRAGAGGVRIVEGALPVDARLVSAEFDVRRQALMFLVESEEFDLVREGELAPAHPMPVFEFAGTAQE